MAVTEDAVGPSSAGTSVSGSATLTWAHTCGASANYLTAVTVENNSQGTDTCTYNGVSMTLLTRIYSNQAGGGAGGYVSLWGLANPATGSSFNVVYTSHAAAGVHIGGSVSYNGVGSAGTPVTGSSNGSVASFSISLNGTTSGGMCVAGACAGSAMSTPTQTGRWLDNVDGNTSADNGAQQDAASTGGTVSLGWSIGSGGDSYGVVAVELLPSGGGGSPAMPPRAARRAAYRTPALPSVRRFRQQLPAPQQALPVSEVAQRRQEWPRGLPRRGRVTFAVPPQLNPPYQFNEIVQRRQEWPRGLPRRGRETFVIPPQLNAPYPVAETAQRRQAHPRALPRRGRVATPVPPQDSPVAEARQQRQPRGFFPRRGRGVTPVPPQLNPPYPFTEARQWRQPRGLLPRRGHGFAPVPAQQSAAPNPAIAFQQARHQRVLFQRRGRTVAPVPEQQATPSPAFQPPRHPRLALPRRGRAASPVPAQQSAPVNPAIAFQPLRHPRLALAPRRGRPLPPVPAQDAPAFQASRHPRLALQRRGRAVQPVPPQVTVAAPAWVQSHRSPLRALALIRRRFLELMPWPQATAPAFSVGALTAGDAPSGALAAAGASSALTAATAAQGTLTATDQRTGGPG